MVHCGSRGFGHQIATDYLQLFLNSMKKYGLKILDRELSCAPFKSPEGQDYFGAMACAANSAFANRQLITHRIREAFSQTFGRSAEELGMHIIYDVAHNIAKIEKHEIDGEEKEVIVHRKGATRSFPPDSPDVTEIYRAKGQPVIVGGSMETGSYLLAGTHKASQMTFGSTCHGAGRVMSRMAAKRKVRGTELRQRMTERGMVVRAVSMSGLAEEAGLAYKNIDEVVNTVDNLGISKKVQQLKPLGSIKG